MEDMENVFENGIEEIDKRLAQLDKELMEELNSPAEDAKPHSELTTTKTFYLDENNNEVPEEEATKIVMQIYDEEGNMIKEVWGTTKKDVQTEEDAAEYVEIYVNDEGNEVSKEEATYMIFRKMVDGKVVEEDKFPLVKQEEGMTL